jgi:hypothetical protein
MKVTLPCSECAEGSTPEQVSLELEDDGVYIVICSAGHRNAHVIAKPKFEVLFELALLALLDGYTRESVASLAASVEELLRVYVQVVLLKHGLYGDEHREQVAKTRKLLKRAEPQLGAFVLAHLIDTHRAPELPETKWVEFRNRVIHAGEIPKREDVIAYGDRLMKFMLPLYRHRDDGIDIAIVTAEARLHAIYRRDEKPGRGTRHETAFAWSSRQQSLHPFADALKFASERSFLRTPGA